MRSSSVSINLKKDQILIKLNENAEQENTEQNTEKKVTDIIKKAKEKGNITYGELATELGEANPEQIDKVFATKCDYYKYNC